MTVKEKKEELYKLFKIDPKNPDFFEYMDSTFPISIMEILHKHIENGYLDRFVKGKKRELRQLSKKYITTMEKIVERCLLLDKSITMSTRDIIAQSLDNLKLNTDKKYRVIYADPPWDYAKYLPHKYGDARKYYGTMTLDELCEMPVYEIAEKDCTLFLWTTSPKLEQSFQVMRSWGFEYKTSFIWYKVKHNFGFYNSVRHEILLIGGRGSSTPDVKKLFNSVQIIERSDNHSEKPEEFREIIDTLYTNGNKIELFARKETEGWDTFGNQIDE